MPIKNYKKPDSTLTQLVGSAYGSIPKQRFVAPVARSYNPPIVIPPDYPGPLLVVDSDTTPLYLVADGELCVVV